MAQEHNPNPNPTRNSAEQYVRQTSKQNLFNIASILSLWGSNICYISSSTNPACCVPTALTFLYLGASLCGTNIYYCCTTRTTLYDLIERDADRIAESEVKIAEYEAKVATDTITIRTLERTVDQLQQIVIQNIIQNDIGTEGTNTSLGERPGQSYSTSNTIPQIEGRETSIFIQDSEDKEGHNSSKTKLCLDPLQADNNTEIEGIPYDIGARSYFTNNIKKTHGPATTAISENQSNARIL